MQQSDEWDATANSGALLETLRLIDVPEPSTWAMLMLGFACFRKTKSAAVLAA